jgi:hypothetical protein
MFFGVSGTFGARPAKASIGFGFLLVKVYLSRDSISRYDILLVRIGI